MLTAAEIAELEARQKELHGVFMAESNSRSWPDTDTKQGRGDCVWMKKNALATLDIIKEIDRILCREKPLQQVAEGETAPADPLDKLRADSEARALAMTGRPHGNRTPH